MAKRKSLTPKMPGVTNQSSGIVSPQKVAKDMKAREDARKRRELAKRMSGKKTAGKSSGYAAGRTLLGKLLNRAGLPAFAASMAYQVYKYKKNKDATQAQYESEARRIAKDSMRVARKPSEQNKQGRVVIAGEKVKVSDRALKALKTVEVKDRAMDKPAKAKEPTEKKVSFGKAFAEARKAGKKEFTWNGKRYHTRTKEEEAARKKASAAKGARRNNARRRAGGTTATTRKR
jgi:hypothetical protein